MFKNNYRVVINAIISVIGAVSAAYAQDYPVRPVRIIVPFAPGGATDFVARSIALKLNQAWDQSVVVDNRAGGGGNLGGEIAARAYADGYTLLMASGSLVTANQHLYRKMPFDPARDLIAITGAASGPLLVTVNPGFAAKTLKALIATAKARPKALTFGSAGFSSQTHLATENLMYATGIEAMHAPYKGDAFALVDLVEGKIHFSVPNMAAAIGLVQQGKLRALAVTSKERAKALPDVAAVAETIPGFESTAWFGLMSATGTPPAVIRKVHDDTTKILQSPDFVARLAQRGMAPYLKDPQVLARAIKDESAHWAHIVKSRNLVPPDTRDGSRRLENFPL